MIRYTVRTDDSNRFDFETPEPLDLEELLKNPVLSVHTDSGTRHFLTAHIVSVTERPDP